MKQLRGFTQIELLLVLAIMTVVVGISFSVLQLPYAEYVQQRIQTTMTNRAALVMSQIARDVRSALPNSVRSGTTALELLSTTAVARYRAEGPAGENERLRAGSPDSEFNTLTALGNLGTTAGEYLAVYPLGLAASDPWAGAAMTPQLASLSVTATVPPGPAGYDNEFHVAIAPPHTFPLQSPARRVYRVSGPVSYICEDGKILRFSGYPVAAVQPASAADFAPASGIVVAAGVADCAFNYTVVNARQAVVTANIELAENGETVRLSWQTAVENTP